MTGIRLFRRRRVDEEDVDVEENWDDFEVEDIDEEDVETGEKKNGKRREIPSEILEALVFFLNSVVFLGLGTTILRLSDVANVYIERILVVAPDYAQYVGYGYVVGYALVAYSVMQMLLSALKLHDAKERRRVEVLVKSEVAEDAS